MGGINASVRIHVKLSPQGVPTASIARGTGNERVDRVAYYIACNTMWLPALRYGKPVEYEFEYELGFSTVRTNP